MNALRVSQCLQQRFLRTGLLDSLLGVLKLLAPPDTSSHARSLSCSEGVSRCRPHSYHHSNEHVKQQQQQQLQQKQGSGRQEQVEMQAQQEQQEVEEQEEQEKKEKQEVERNLPVQACASASVAPQICVAVLETLSLLLAGNREVQVREQALQCDAMMGKRMGGEGGREGGREGM